VLWGALWVCDLGCELGVRLAVGVGGGGEGEVDTQVDRRHSVCSVFAFGRAETLNPILFRNINTHYSPPLGNTHPLYGWSSHDSKAQ